MLALNATTRQQCEMYRTGHSFGPLDPEDLNIRRVEQPNAHRLWGTWHGWANLMVDDFLEEGGRGTSGGDGIDL
jgi:hypothetical protein